MLRPAIVAFFSTVVAGVLLAMPAAAADPAPAPPPGSVGVQPAGATTDQPGAYHCGVTAGAAGNGYVVQPQQISSSGASSPSGCGASTPSGGGTQPSSSGQRTSSGGGAQTQAAAESQAGQTKNGDVVPAASVHGASGGFLGGPLWIGLLLFLALLLLLIGFALGRRRQPARATA